MLYEALTHHLKRLTLGSLASIAAAAIAFWQDFASFAIVTMIWACMNLLIALLSARSKRTIDLRALREFLALNLGLNVGYIGVGMVMLWLPNSESVEAGVAVVIQGLLLLVLDSLLLIRLPKTAIDDRHAE
jgi:uncharacterized metal-binding protein